MSALKKMLSNIKVELRSKRSKDQSQKRNQVWSPNEEMQDYEIKTWVGR